MAVTYLFLDRNGSVTPVEQDSVLRAIEDLVYTLPHAVLKIELAETGPHVWKVRVFETEDVPTEEWVVTIDGDEALAE